jgi:hypothetical protein
LTAPTTQIQVPPGTVVLTTYGSITMETHACLAEMRAACQDAGLRPTWPVVPGSLVDRARNAAVVNFLNTQPPLGWLLFVDGDAVFQPNALLKLLQTAYADRPDADVVGAFCTLRGEPYLPTIDTGTGTWESWLPGQGVVDVMRTGSAFILIKRHVFEKIPGPWYGTRNPMRPIDALAEVDNFAHTKFDGKNPLAETPEWQALLQCAKDDPSSRNRHDISSFVGEDSNACDWMRFQGLRIVVNTDVEVHHVDRVIRSAADHRDVMKKRDGLLRACVGLQR